MKIVILSRSEQIYSTYRLQFAARARGHEVFVVDHLKCKLFLSTNRADVIFGEKPLRGVQAIIPRIGASVSFYGASVIQQFEMNGVYTPVPSEALFQARNKLRTLQLLSRSGIGIPRTFFTHYSNELDAELDGFGDRQLVVKILESTQGEGVILAPNRFMADSVIETFNQMRRRFLVQEFIEECSGTDIRAFVVGREIVASMKRQAQEGEFRSNIHRGGIGLPINLTEKERWTALQAVRMLNLEVAGVDILRSNSGPLLLEVNPSPGLEGIEKTTGIDIANKIIQFIERRVRDQKEK